MKREGEKKLSKSARHRRRKKEEGDENFQLSEAFRNGNQRDTRLVKSIEKQRQIWETYKEDMRNFENQNNRSYDVYAKMISDFHSLILTRNEAPQYCFPVDVGKSNIVNVIDDVNDSVPLETFSSTLIRVHETSSASQPESVNKNNSLLKSVAPLNTFKHALKLGRLSAKELKTVNRFIRGESSDIIKDGCNSVSRDSMTTLKPRKWLNDEVINYFLKVYLTKRDKVMCQEDPHRKRSHFFCTFFVTTLLNERNNCGSVRGRYNYNSVKRWSKNVPGEDIFKLKYLIFPINAGYSHWSSIIVFMEKKLIQFYDSLFGAQTTNLHLEGIFRYLKDEHMSKKREHLDVSKWRLEGNSASTPVQENGYDCGVFTCMYAENVTRDCDPKFTQDDLINCRNRMILAILKGN